MFLYVLVAVIVGAGVHIGLSRDRSRERIGEIGLLWVLVGYCGVPIVAVSLLSLVHPHEVAHWLGLPPDNPFQTFVSVANLAMAVIALLSLRYRGTYLIGPAVAWAVFFGGATFVHWAQGAHGEGSHGPDHISALAIFATHGLIALLLLAGLAASGVWRNRS